MGSSRSWLPPGAKPARRLLLAAPLLLAAQLPGAARAEPSPAWLPAAVAAVSITANGARGNDVSGDETAAMCSRFRLQLRDVRAYFARAQPVDARAYHHDLEMSRCHAEGRVAFVNGQRGRWRIDQERRSLVLLPGRVPILLYCPRCTTPAFAPVYDPERDG
jgi:hypothetical protein